MSSASSSISSSLLSSNESRDEASTDVSASTFQPPSRENISTSESVMLFWEEDLR
jgi:hypothetical protein